jgi:hypothetical protein
MAVFQIALVNAVCLQAAVGNIPLIVQEAIYPGVSGLARTSEPVTVGVPLPDGAGIRPGAGGAVPLALSGASAGQFRCLGTWPSGNCKWVLVDTLVNIGSSGPYPGSQNTSIAVIDGAGNFGGSNLGADSDPANPNSGTITISTGAATFVIRKANFNLIDQATVGGTPIIASGASQGMVLTGPSAGGTTCGPCTTVYSSSNDANSIAILEENGPVKAVVKASGAHKDASGNSYMRYTVRLFFYAGQPYVRVKVELRNADENVSAFASAYKAFASYEAKLATAATGTKTFAFGGRSGSVSGTYSSTEDAYLYQAYSNFMEFSDWNSGNLSAASHDTILPRSSGGGCSDTWCYPDTNRSDEGYVIKAGTSVLEAGNRSQYPAGWGDIGDSSGSGIMAGFYYMSGYWPKSVEFDNGGSALVMGIWPKQNPHFYNQAWPQYSITDFYLQFHSTALSSPGNSFLNLQYNLVARAGWASYNSAGVFPYTFPTPAEEDAYYQRIASTANPAVSPAAQCCINDFAPNVFRYYAWPATGGGNQADFRWAYQLQFLSRGFTGRYLWAQNFYRFIAESALARSDFAGGWRNHAAQGDISSNGFPGNVPSANVSLGGSRDWIEAAGEHTHLYGIFDWYYATGDESLKDAISQGIYDRYLNPGIPNNTGVGLWNARALGAQLMTDARLHDFLTSIGDSTDAATAYNIAEATLNKQVRATLTSPGYDGRNGTDKNRGFQWGCCSYVSWDNPPAAGGPGGAGTARAAGTFQHSILIEGIYEYLHSRGASWSGYEDLADLAYGMYAWIRDEMTVPTTSWSPTSNGGGLRYYVAVDHCNSTPGCVSAGNAVSGAQTNNETLWMPYYWDHEYTGDTSWTGMFQILLNGLAASSGVSWSENGIYTVSATVYKSLHPTANPALVDVPFTMADIGGGNYVLTFTPPAGATSLKIKWGERLLVNSLGFDPMVTNKYAIDPTTHQTWWSAHNVQGEPAATPGASQSFTLTAIAGLSSGNFSVKAYAAGAAAPPTGPPGLRLISGNGQTGAPSAALANPLVVAVADPAGNPVAGVAVTFAIASGGGTLSAPSATTNSLGQASTTLTLGTATGNTIVTATASGLTGSPVSFTETATATGTGGATAAWVKSAMTSTWPQFRGLTAWYTIRWRKSLCSPPPTTAQRFTATVTGLTTPRRTTGRRRRPRDRRTHASARSDRTRPGTRPTGIPTTGSPTTRCAGRCISSQAFARERCSRTRGHTNPLRIPGRRCRRQPSRRRAMKAR